MSSTRTRFRIASLYTVANTPSLALQQPKALVKNKMMIANNSQESISYNYPPKAYLFQNNKNLLRWLCNNIY